VISAIDSLHEYAAQIPRIIVCVARSWMLYVDIARVLRSTSISYVRVGQERVIYVFRCICLLSLVDLT
jgi:hypothetical protein